MEPRTGASTSPTGLPVVSPTSMTSPAMFSSASPIPGTTAGIVHSSAHIIPAMPSPTHSGGIPANPLGGSALGGYPHQQPLMVYAPYSPVYLYSNSPLPSPLASPKTSGKLQGSNSYVAINRGTTDSFLKWLKSLRLHKYHPIFEKLTYDEVCLKKRAGWWSEKKGESGSEG